MNILKALNANIFHILQNIIHPYLYLITDFCIASQNQNGFDQDYVYKD